MPQIGWQYQVARLHFAGPGLATLLATLAPEARADPQANTRFVPLQVESAIPVRTGLLEAEVNSRYVRDRHNERGRDLTVVEPLLRLGLIPRVHVTVGLPYRLGDQSTANQGAGSFGALVGLTDQTSYLPALGLAVTYDTPYGAGHKTAEYAVRALATRDLGEGERAPRLHLNLLWTHLTQPGRAERPDQIGLIVGASALVGEHTALFLEVVHGAKPERRQTQTLLEAALRHEIGSWFISAGAGVGIAGKSPAVRVLLSATREFKLF